MLYFVTGHMCIGKIPQEYIPTVVILIEVHATSGEYFISESKMTARGEITTRENVFGPTWVHQSSGVP